MLAFGSLLSSLLIIGVSIGVIVVNMEVYNQINDTDMGTDNQFPGKSGVVGVSVSELDGFKNKLKISTIMAGALGGIFLILSLASIGFFTIFVLNK